MNAVRAALPWYVHPAAAPLEWAWLAAQNVSFAVVNVHNGPGTDDDAYYPEALAGLRNIRLLGYVPVGFGDRDPAQAAEDIRTWRRLYGVDGILLDELPADPQSLDRCEDYAAAARAEGVTFLAANPGAFPTPQHLKLFDVTSVFEGSADAYAGFSHPGWAARVPPSRLWHLVHTCPPEQTAAICRSAGRRGAGYAYATDRTVPNPWLGPPTAVSARLAAGRERQKAPPG